MNIIESIRMSLYNLVSNKMRSMLTMLGIIIGVGSVIALQSIGEGTIQNALAQVQRAGTNLITISPSNQSFLGIATGAANQTLSYEDYLNLAADPSLTAAAGVDPELNNGGQIVFGSLNANGRIIGTTQSYPTVHDQTLSSGDWFTDADVSSNSTVVVLGSSIADTLFQGDDPIGKQIRINRTSFTVVGVMTARGGTGFGSVDSQVYMPITTAQTKLFGARNQGATTTGKRVDSIVLKASSANNVEKLIGEATLAMRDLHKIQGTQDDFTITNQQDQLQAARDQQNTLNTFLIVIASISLFVGGIGIMNIMLVTVTERTREIGIRKAIGAKPFDILLQFIIESITLCFVGGLIGVVLGVIASEIVNATFIHTAVNVSVMFMAVGFAIAVGLFFGIYPARRAAKLHPIDALRYD
ncbi:MAG: ABC transporter permease [Chloroflexi bacterium]|uniref:ABC transporter permease n=1 Tax=Candidatus Chlorohelix allophototropha TaxID=3003348 RepID=A0A8T7M6T8_9CHLR|nr:ABC transporter permease [Chloroflexota bacterium]WJW69724.1 ABC transporter permease [Chloroflexota bacterium L227-S17]